MWRHAMPCITPRLIQAIKAADKLTMRIDSKKNPFVSILLQSID